MLFCFFIFSVVAYTRNSPGSSKPEVNFGSTYPRSGGVGVVSRSNFK